MSSAAEIEAVLFRKSETATLFQAPNPWVLGRRAATW